MTLPQPVPGILEIAPYVGGRAKAPGVTRVFKLSSNESPLGPSPKAVEAFKAAAPQLNIYPEGSAAVLRQSIAQETGLNADRVICGNGSDELLHLLALVYSGPGDEVLYTEHGFHVYKIAALAAGAKPVTAPETNLTADVDALLAAVTPRTKLVCIANPNNPTGTYIAASEMRRLRDALPERCVLVIDAAYAEYVKRADYTSGVELAEATPNTVMTRTFSKIHGLAGLRVGWAYAAPAIIDAVNRVRAPFNVSIPGQQAAAAAVKDKAHVETSAAYNAKWLSWLRDRIAATGLNVRDSVCNFLLIEFAKDGAKTAAAADEFLMQRGLILRGVAANALPHCLRLSVGTEEANRLVVQAFEEFMGSK
ncbi:MAG: histidinol-phosphate transaminase [Alphaproteobacteria bacterium]|nr:histidinol-phosphate transaminase [Alphaproteobacteria bacterium]